MTLKSDQRQTKNGGQEKPVDDVTNIIEQIYLPASQFHK